MSEISGAAGRKSTVRKIGLKNLAFCGVWGVIALFMFLTRLWFSINNFFVNQLPSNFSGTVLEPLLRIVGLTLGFTLLIGWILYLPSALIMSATGYYPHFLRGVTAFKPEDEPKK